MSLKRLIIICTLPSFLVGCAEFYGSQPPAPVYDGHPKAQKPSISSQKKSKSRSKPAKEIVKTQPLKDFSEIKTEPLAPVELPSSEPVPLEATPLDTTPLETSEPSSPPVSSETLERSLPPSPQLTPFEPIESTVPLSPAVNALILASNQNSKAGDIDSAAASIERAIRIEPRNATLFYKLALLRLKQSKPRLAEDLAKKSALLASTDNTLKKHCWLLIAHAREIQQDFTGAKEAREKAGGF
jgi:hypothetical protein